MSAPYAITAALASASLFGVAAAAQHHEARSITTSFRPSLLLSLARRPLWLAATLGDLAGAALQGVALAQGSVALVQTLLVAGLPLAALVSSSLGDRTLHRRELIGLALCATGLALLAPALATTSEGGEPGRRDAVLAGVAVTAVVLLLLTGRGHPRWRGVTAGAAAGVVIGAGAVLLSITAGRVGDWSALFSSWAPYVALVVGLLGLLLSQMAFQTGDLGLPLATLTVIEPIVAVAIASTVLHEHLPTGTVPRLLGLSGAVLAVLGVAALCRRDEPEPA